MNRHRKTVTLRAAAETRLQNLLATNLAEVGDTDLRRLVHELQVHQIELEMQNNELRQARAETESALSRYTELYDFAPVAYLTLTPAGLITEINLTGATLLGVERKKLRNKKFATFVVPEDQSRWAAHFANLKLEIEHGSVELAIKRGDGTVFHAQLDCLRHQDGECAEDKKVVHGVRVAMADISERKRIELERNHALAAAEKANNAKSDFLSSMSHELRTPLSAMLGFAQLIESGAPTPTPGQQRSLNQILQSGWYLLELINEILDLALIESGKLSASISRETVALAEVMLECQAMTEPQAKKRQITVVFSPPAKPCFVQADRTRLKQVIINLLSNAIKYNRPGGRVVVDCRTAAPGRLRISIRDTGEGMGPERLQQLFQPFNRLGQEAKAQEGTGIGLVLCKRLTELMGGIIGVESAVGTGSVFWIELSQAMAQPLVVDQGPPAVVQDAASVDPDAPVSTLLYVEDSPAHLMLVEEIVARRPDIRLLSARDGDRGVKIARAFRPDVILMDITLPGVDGVSAMKMLAEDPATAHIPVLALSANAMPRDIEHGLWAGFFRYLTKPLKVSEFLESLDAALNIAHKEARSASRKDEENDY